MITLQEIKQNESIKALVRATVIWKRLAIPITAPGTWAM